jgi:hypothetical protein
MRTAARVSTSASGTPAACVTARAYPLDLVRSSDREPDGGAAVTGTDDALVFRAVRESVLGQFADLADIAINGDRDAAEIARRHFPRLAAGMRASLAGLTQSPETHPLTRQLAHQHAHTREIQPKPGTATISAGSHNPVKDRG